MKTLTCISPGHFEYTDTPEPQPAPGHALIQVQRIGICGTDLHAYEGTQPFFNYPRILGHELSGTLMEAAGAPGFTAGQKVSLIPYFGCGHCIACHTGKENCCADIKVFGVHIDGGMRAYISIPSKYLLQGEGLGYDELALVEPLAIGAHGIRRAGVQPGEFVLVIGAGPIGLGTMEFARIAGAHVIALDINDNRLQFCREKLGVQSVINPSKINAVEALQALTGGDMASVVIDATGNLNAINGGLQYLAHGGRYVLIGLQKAAFSFSHPEFHKRESTLMSSRNATRADFEHVISCLQKKLVDPKTYITHRVSFGEVKDNFASWLNPANGVIKAMVEMG